MYTSSKPTKISSMKHEEDEEIQHDTSKLQHQVHQISLSQRVTKTELEAMMNVKMDGLKGDMNGIKRDMEVLRGGLKE